MKKLTTVLLSIFFVSNLFSQDTISIQKEIGFDITSVFNIIKSSSYNQRADDIFLYYKTTKGDKTTRYGLGGLFEIETSKNSASVIRLNLSIGREKRIDLSNRWQIYRGFDYRLLFSGRYGSGGYVNSSGIALGIAPLIGVKFKIVPRLWISTEMSYGFFIGVNDSSDSINIRLYTELFAPGSLFLFYRF